MSSIIFWSVFGYLLGAIPFAYILGKLFVKQDIRNVGDGNPGGTNTWKAGGWKIGLLAILLEIFKGYLPVVEELPWLWAMQAESHRVEHAAGTCGVVLEAAVRIALSRRENPLK